jgi:hypothetical protein
MGHFCKSEFLQSEMKLLNRIFGSWMTKHEGFVIWNQILEISFHFGDITIHKSGPFMLIMAHFDQRLYTVIVL